MSLLATVLAGLSLSAHADITLSSRQVDDVLVCAEANGSLETVAQQGQLSRDTTECLEHTVLNTSKGDAKRQASYLLIADAYARGDQGQWSALTRRHLQRIDDSDPDLAYRYALHLASRGPGAEPEVRHWLDVAISHTEPWKDVAASHRQQRVNRLVEWVMAEPELKHPE